MYSSLIRCVNYYMYSSLIRCVNYYMYSSLIRQQYVYCMLHVLLRCTEAHSLHSYI